MMSRKRLTTEGDIFVFKLLQSHIETGEAAITVNVERKGEKVFFSFEKRSHLSKKKVSL